MGPPAKWLSGVKPDRGFESRPPRLKLSTPLSDDKVREFLFYGHHFGHISLDIFFYITPYMLLFFSECLQLSWDIIEE